MRIWKSVCAVLKSAIPMSWSSSRVYTVCWAIAHHWRTSWRVKQKYGAYLMVDEAHSLGVLGENGRGLAEEADVEDGVDFVVGTFSKSLGAIGGFCVSNHPELDLVRYASRPYVFTASSSPSIIASTRQALKILTKKNRVAPATLGKCHRLYKQLQDLGFTVGPEPSPIVAVRLEDKAEAFALWSGLLERKVYTSIWFYRRPHRMVTACCAAASAPDIRRSRWIGSAKLLPLFAKPSRQFEK